jgi:hypothetical protein
MKQLKQFSITFILLLCFNFNVKATEFQKIYSQSEIRDEKIANQYSSLRSVLGNPSNTDFSEMSGFVELEVKQEKINTIYKKDIVSRNDRISLISKQNEEYIEKLTFNGNSTAIYDELVMATEQLDNICRSEFALFGKYYFNNRATHAPMVVHLAKGESPIPIKDFKVTNNNHRVYNQTVLFRSILRRPDGIWYQRQLNDSILIQQVLDLDVPANSFLKLNSSTPIKRVNFRLSDGIVSSRVVGSESLIKLDSNSYELDLKELFISSSERNSINSTKNVKILGIYIYFEKTPLLISDQNIPVIPQLSASIFLKNRHAMGTVERKLALTNSNGSLTASGLNLSLKNEFTVEINSPYQLSDISLDVSIGNNEHKIITHNSLVGRFDGFLYHYLLPTVISKKAIDSSFEAVGYEPVKLFRLNSVIVRHRDPLPPPSHEFETSPELKIIESVFNENSFREYTIIPKEFNQNNTEEVAFYSLKDMRFKGRFDIDHLGIRWVLKNGDKSCVVPKLSIQRQNRIPQQKPYYSKLFESGISNRFVLNNSQDENLARYSKVENIWFFNVFSTAPSIGKVDGTISKKFSDSFSSFQISGSSNFMYASSEGHVYKAYPGDNLKIMAEISQRITADSILLKTDADVIDPFYINIIYVDGTIYNDIIFSNKNFNLPAPSKHIQSITLNKKFNAEETATLISLSLSRLVKNFDQADTSGFRKLELNYSNLDRHPFVALSSKELLGGFNFILIKSDLNNNINFNNCLIYPLFIYDDKRGHINKSPIIFDNNWMVVNPLKYGLKFYDPNLVEVQLHFRSCSMSEFEIFHNAIISSKTLFSDFLTNTKLFNVDLKEQGVDYLLEKSAFIFNKVYIPLSSIDLRSQVFQHLNKFDDPHFNVAGIYVFKELGSSTVKKDDFDWYYIYYFLGLVFFIALIYFFHWTFPLADYLQLCKKFLFSIYIPFKIRLNSTIIINVVSLCVISIGLLFIIIAFLIGKSYSKVSFIILGFLFITTVIRFFISGNRDIISNILWNSFPLSILVFHSLNLFPDFFGSVTLRDRALPWIIILSAIGVFVPWILAKLDKGLIAFTYPIIFNLLFCMAFVSFFILGTRVSINTFWAVTEIFIFSQVFIFLNSILMRLSHSKVSWIASLSSSRVSSLNFIWNTIFWMLVGSILSLASLNFFAEHAFNCVFYGLVCSVICMFREVDSSSKCKAL